MIAFATMLAQPAEQAGIKLPPDTENFDPFEYPHWTVYRKWQIGRAMPWPGIHFENAKIIAAVPDDVITTITQEELHERGAL